MVQAVKNTGEFEVEIKLYINRRLYETGTITGEMYIRAKEVIMKG